MNGSLFLLKATSPPRALHTPSHAGLTLPGTKVLGTNGLATLTARFFLQMKNSTYSSLFHRDTAVPFARADTVREHKQAAIGNKHEAAQLECRTS